MSFKQQKYFKQVLLSLFILCLFSTLLISLTNKFTSDRIKRNQQQHTLKIVTEVMPLLYDNELLNDKTAVIDSNSLGKNATVYVYRARNNNNPVGLVFMPVTTKGYSGLIELAVGISYDGTLTGVRVNKHQETEGLGDRIDQRKSDWILIFDQLSLQNTPTTNWSVKKDGGDLDQLSGATISSRAVIDAVKSTLDYYELNRDKLY